jgi:hypothetical protein
MSLGIQEQGGEFFKEWEKSEIELLHEKGSLTLFYVNIM